LCLALIVGYLITSEHGADAKLAQRLKRNGRAAQATITKKLATSSGQGRDFCYITYQFQARQAAAPNAPVATFSREVEVQDGFFDSVAEGQRIVVVYDPVDPSVSSAEALILRPRYPTWIIWTWWIGMAISLSMLIWSCVVQSRLSRGRRSHI
jgi:hypothetical protein